MSERVLIVGLDEPEHLAIRERLGVRVVASETLPRIMVRGRELFAESPRSFGFLPISKVVFHGIFEDDFDFICALALWGGPCFPNARAMMETRLKLPCLVHALQFSSLGATKRGFAGPGVSFEVERESVAKWGNWHCGENKARFGRRWTSDDACLIEDYLPGVAVRVVIIGEHRWQIRMEGDGWLKSIHSPNASFMDIDEELIDDTERIRRGFSTEILANDYIVGEDGSKYLLEVNQIPNVTKFSEIWEAYRDAVVMWVEGRQ